MQLDRAKEIIQALADGVDPYSGDHFPADGPYQRADTVRALHTAIETIDLAMSGTARKRPARRADPDKPKAGGPWTPEEEQRLRDAFASHRQSTQHLPAEAQGSANREWAKQIAANHGRTPGAISSRLVRLGLLDDTAANRSGHGNAPGSKPYPLPSDTAPPPVNPDDDKIPF